MNMRKSRVLEKMRAGGIVNCFKTNLSDGRVCELAALHGFDCVWLGMEHIANTWATVERQIWATKAHDVDAMVRVSRGSYSDYIKPLELDAAGIMVPHVMSREEAENVVRMTRFHPVGRRPVDGGNADGAFCNIDFKEYLKQANEQRFIAIQIEDPEPLDELEAIAELDGIDMLFFGPGDFSHGIGAPGDFNHPKLIETRKRVAETARKYGKFAGTTGDIESLSEFVDMGYQFICVISDVGALNESFRRIVDEFTKRCRTL